MKHWLFGLALAGLLTSPALAAKTPRTVSEYFQAPDDSPYKIQAVKSTVSVKDEWLIRFGSARKRIVGDDSTWQLHWFVLSFDETAELIRVSRQLLASSDSLKPTQADTYEEKIGITNDLDLIYRKYFTSGGGVEFWMAQQGETVLDSSWSLTRGTFESFIKHLEAVLEKAKANQAKAQ